MNHIMELTIVRDGLSKELAAYHGAIMDLKSYLLSDKFHVDTTVQVKDVLMRLEEAQRVAMEVRDEHDRAAYLAEKERQEKREAKGRRNCERCGWFGYDWEDTPMKGGYTVRICRKCFNIALHENEVAI